ncbi:hypothetical protein DUI87_34403 [Hirundo rustica rustica]|uniref:Uncharacterized protein n=1 Tax=Hirundo rustica rustica TaxID=333673 RepID=A0A3M0IQQ3_HIRRU|nr:hypothetical protein DUI87_34403 [Hirundo rustica rustica]
MTEPQLGTQALQREGGGWNVAATLTNTRQTENCFALAAANSLKSEDPPPPIPILEGPQKCSDDLQLTDWHEVTREICKEENLNPLAMPVIFSQQARGPRTGTPIPSQDMKELRKVIKDSGICSPYFKELLKNTLERTHQTLKRILSQVKRGKAQATPQKRLKKTQEVFEKGEKIIQILLKAGFAIKRSKVKGPAQEIQFLGVKWQDGRRQIPTEVINKIIAMSPPTSKKETQAFLGAIGFWRMHIPEYSQIVSPLYLVTRKKNDFHWGPEQQQAFAQIKQEIAHAVALGPVRTGPEVKNVLYSAAGNNGLSWSLWQKVPGETRGRPLGFWSQSYRGSEANYTPTEKEILAAYEGLQAASERARIGNPNRPGILEIITNWPEGETFGLSFEEEEEQVTRAEEAPPYNELPETERQYALFTDGSCRIVGANRKWKAAVWSPTRRVAQATEGQGGSSQIAELKAIQLALDIAEREKWPRLYLYTDSWMVANALWGWLNRWKKANWQRRGKPIWAAEIWQDIAARVEKLTVKVRHVDAHVSKSQANEEHHNNEQVDKAAKVKVSQVIHNCETCAAIKQAKRVKPLWYGGRWLKYRYGEAWQIDYITLPQTRQGKRYVLTMVEATTGWLETYPVPHATARNTILGLEKQVLWRHGTPERIESDNGTHFKNGLINTWAREHGIEWIYHIPYHAPAAGKVERCNGLLKTTLKALGGGTSKNWELNLAKATWMVNTRGSINRAGPAQSEPLHTVDGDKVPVVHMKGILGKTVWINPTSSKGRPIRGIVFAQGPGSTWWVMQKDGETRCVPQGDLILSEN